MVIEQDAYDLEFNRLYKTYDMSGLKVNLDKTKFLAENTDRYSIQDYDGK